MKKLMRWFNDFRKGYVRFRICERCYKFTQNVHWTKDDKVVWKNRVLENKDKSMHNRIIQVPYVRFSHTWLCDMCFYAPILKKTPK